MLYVVIIIVLSMCIAAIICGTCRCYTRGDPYRIYPELDVDADAHARALPHTHVHAVRYDVHPHTTSYSIVFNPNGNIVLARML